MSGHHARPGPQPRHPAHPAIWAAAAAIILLALAACTSTSHHASTAASAVAAASAGPGGHKPTLTGAGSTFDAPFFAVAFAKYHQQHPAVSISYSAVGSSAGIAAFSAQQVDFGASDVPMTASEQAAAKGGPVTQVPVDLGGEGVVYNLSLPAGARLHLTGPVLAAIFLGQITRWNDPAITALNPGLALPAAAITVVHRSDGSGTTYIFSNYLSSVDPAWAAKVGTGKTLHWPAGEGAEGNGGVAAAVYRTPFSIGYVEQAYSQGLLLPFAAIRNQAGNYVIPSTQTVAADAAQKPAITPADFSIVNQPGASSYPITGYSWALVYTRQPNQATGQALVTMLDWLTHDGQAYAAANGYVPLPPQIQQLARTMLQQITGPSRNPPAGLTDQTSAEWPACTKAGTRRPRTALRRRGPGIRLACRQLARMMDGMHVEAINIGPSDALGPVESVRAIAGQGLEGDRYFAPDGAGPGEALTLIEAEVLEDVGLSGPQSRRRSWCAASGSTT